MPEAPEREPARNSSRVRTVPFCAGTLNTKTLRDDFKLASLPISCAKLSQDLPLIQGTHRNDSEDLTINHNHFHAVVLWGLVYRPVYLLEHVPASAFCYLRTASSSATHECTHSRFLVAS